MPAIKASHPVETLLQVAALQKDLQNGCVPDLQLR
jgi:hypothetical protein